MDTVYSKTTPQRYKKKQYTKYTMPSKLVQKTGEFGRIYDQFKNQPKKAILHLKKVRNGECPKALYRSDIGYIDIVWGENDPRTNKGYGLKHIIEKHGKEIKQLGFEVEDFIVIAFQFGQLKVSKSEAKFILENNLFRIIILTEWKGKAKQLLLTAFDLQKKPKK